MSEVPDHIDLEALDAGPMLRYARTATFAPNWKSVLAADGFVGFVILAIGIALGFWIIWVGLPVIVAGIVYIFLVVRRFLQWRWLRRRAGL